MGSLSEEQLRTLMSPGEALRGDVNEGLPSLHGAPSGGRRYTGLGRAVKLSSTVVLPPSTAGSAHICGPKEAKGGGTNPSIVIKRTLPQRGGGPFSFLFIIFVCHSWHSSRRFSLSTLQTSTRPPWANLVFLRHVLLFVWLSSTYTSLQV